MMRLKMAALSILSMMVVLGPVPALRAAEKLIPVTLLTNWYAQPEHGGFYAAKAAGIYAMYGLDVTIKMGGPQVNNEQLLAAGATDFSLGFGLQSLTAVREGLPTVTVAAFFQRDPQTLMVHAGSGYDRLAALKGVPIRIPTTGRSSYWPWLKARFGFTDDQLRPYDYSIGPFVADPKVVQQGYITEDAFQMKRAGVDGRSLLLADFGWTAYAATLDTTTKMVQQRPQVVAAFVKASSEGWKLYFQDPAPANALIKKDNPENDDALTAYKVQAMQRYMIVGAHPGLMTDERWSTFFADAVQAGILPRDLNYRQAYVLQFVNGL